MPECPHCRSPHKPGDRYCNQCGERLAAPEFMASSARTQKSLNLVDVRYNLGVVYFKKGQYLEALATWEKALEKDPDNPELRERIAEVRRRIGEND
ncbi:MAG: tetratricopeptide repeat protein [Candidatus Latescibacterota bacterium]